VEDRSTHPSAASFVNIFRALVVVKNVNILFTNSNIQISREEVDETPELHDLRNFVTEPEYETDEDPVVEMENLRTDEEALDYFSGYASRKLGLECRFITPDDPSWTGLRNLGRLVRGTPEVEANIRKINTAFNTYHKNGKLVSGVRIPQRTCDYILRQEECKLIQRALVELFVKVKINHMIKTINSYMPKTGRNKLRDHVKNGQFSN